MLSEFFKIQFSNFQFFLVSYFFLWIYAAIQLSFIARAFMIARGGQYQKGPRSSYLFSGDIQHYEFFTTSNLFPLSVAVLALSSLIFIFLLYKQLKNVVVGLKFYIYLICLTLIPYLFTKVTVQNGFNAQNCFNPSGAWACITPSQSILDTYFFTPFTAWAIFVSIWIIATIFVNKILIIKSAK